VEETRIALPSERGLRRGGVGDRLPSGGTRLTARKGAAPVALPYAYIYERQPITWVADIAERLELGVYPHEKIVTWEIYDPHMARRHQPGYRVKVTGIVPESLERPWDGPVSGVNSRNGEKRTRRPR